MATENVIGPCLCGDTACPSCNPGYSPEFEMVCEWLQARLAHLDGRDGWPCLDDVVEEFANVLGGPNSDPDVADVVERTARREDKKARAAERRKLEFWARQ